MIFSSLLNRRTLYPCLFLFMCLGNYCVAQENYEPVKAEISTRIKDGAIAEITALATNLSDSIQDVQYQMSVKTVSGNNSSSNTQSGRAILTSGTTKSLSRTSVSAGPETTIKILLLIFDDQKKVLSTAQEIIP